MKATIVKVLLLLITIPAFKPALAQVATGVQPLGSFAGGPDIVNLGNLNANLTIPIRHKAGRGQSFIYDLQYNSSIYTPVESNGTWYWQPDPNWGWQGLAPGGVVYEGYSETYSSGHCGTNGQNSWQSWSYGGFVYYDDHGIKHTFGGVSGSYISADDAPSCPASGSNPSGVLTSSDGTGLTVQFSTDQNGFHATISTATGEVINPPVMVNFTPPAGNLTSTDQNGNQITSDNGAFTDTLGEQALLVQGSAPSDTVLKYTNPQGSYVSYTVSYKAYNIKTNFGCSVTEYAANNVNLVDRVTLPDGRYYQFEYEPTPGYSNYYTGRPASITLPTGGTISYQYTGNNNGIECSDGSTAGLTRTVSDGTTNQTWTYSRASSSPTWTTFATSPSYNGVQDDTVYTFLKGYVQPTYFYEIERQTYAGSHTSGTLKQTVLHCYDAGYCDPTKGDTYGTVAGTTVSPIMTSVQWPDKTGVTSGTLDYYDNAGNLTSHAVYDYGAAGSGVYSTNPLQSTTYSYWNTPSGVETSFPLEVVVKDGAGSTLSDTKYGYDETVTATSGTPQLVAPPNGFRGNVTSVQRLVAAGTWQPATTYTYYDTGNVKTMAGPNGSTTTYTYGDCGNSFATQTSTPVAGGAGVTLTTGAHWDCNGGVPTSTTDLNNNQTAYNYGSDPYWRPMSVTDAATNSTTFTYPTSSSPNTSSTSFSFYGTPPSTSSVNNTVVTTDGLGRTILTQKQQAPGYNYYDTVATSYDSRGRVATQSLPYTTELPPSAGAPTATVRTTYDALNRPVSVVDAGGGTVQYLYSGNDVLVATGPAPSGENYKRRVLEYNGAGQLSSVCEVTGLGGSGGCGQNTSSFPASGSLPATSDAGYLTKYTYDGPNLTQTQQNSQSGNNGIQTRSVQYDDLGRKTQETIPEWSNGSGTPGTSTYTYDSDPSGSCPGSYPGDLIKTVDNAGNVTCYTYDSMHRVLSSSVVAGPYSITQSNTPTPQAYFVYDSVTLPNQQSATNVKGQLARAYTYGCTGVNCTPTLQTDEYFSYSLVGSGSMQGGVLAQMWQKTPNSGNFFLTQDTLYPNGALGARTSSLNGASYGYPTMSYGLDGEGRPYWASDATRCINPVTAATYNASGSATSITFGNASNGGGADVDTFQYDPNTNRPTSLNYFVDASANQFNVHTQLNWNANGSLNQMVYTDENDTSKNQTCSYAADDLSRIVSAQCNSAWAQTFSYDPFGNISKAGSSSYAATYGGPNSATKTNQVSGGFSPAPTYDANGNQLNLTAAPASISWNAWNVPIGISGTTATYDAMGRMVEKVSGGTATQFVFSASGTNIASVSGGVLVKGTVQLPGGDTAIYSGTSGNPYIRHTDWLGSSRLATTWAHAVQSKVAYAPFGETYSEAGAAANDRSFTGQDQNVAQGSLGTGAYDYLFRKYDPSAGRWLSPDPSGWAAVGLADPQSLDRYAYVENQPLNSIDSLGTCDDHGTYTDTWDGNTTSEDWSDNDPCTWFYLGPTFPGLGAGDDGDGNNSQQPTYGGGGAGGPSGCFEPNWLQRKGIALQQKVAQKLGFAVGFGTGISGGIGFGKFFGFYGTASAQMVVTPNGNAYLVYTYGGTGLTQNWLTPVSKGAGFVGGLQFSGTNARNPSDLSGVGVDVSAGGGDGFAGGGDVGVSGDPNGNIILQGTATIGGGSGAFGGAGAITKTKVVPSCSNHQ